MRDRLRPLLAAFLAVLFPGLGHLVLRRWGRALVWHVTIVAGTAALVSLYDVQIVDPLADPMGYAEAIPPEVSLPVAFLVLLSAVDAYLVGREQQAAEARAEAAAEAIRQRVGEDGAGTAVAETPSGVPPEKPEPQTVQCPHCGKETDAEIDFCHWCTEPLPWADDEE